MMELPKRKPNRIPHFDYSTPGAYFVTICTQNRQKIFWENVGASIARPQIPRLSHAGQIVEQAIKNIGPHYPAISVEHYVVMPNHIHLLLQINTDENGRPMVAPTISIVVQQMKGYVTKQLGKSIWQKLFHDHVIRNENDYRIIWEYIENNPPNGNRIVFIWNNHNSFCRGEHRSSADFAKAKSVAARRKCS